MNTEDKPMEFNPRPGTPPEWDDVRIDDDEIRDPEPPQPDAWWQDWLLVAVALLVLVLIFAPLGV